ncbi:Predicted coiled-coil protein [Phaffia rhodozyma]|uniref:Predicted coiled-coil protein n=1 Tax=Phaffia rhodozyma TaxID=264483 RepID=A0A0F7SFJ7_PHARH|nr:Predicted coiled-coil protein [Phaffia rhodozyma]
MFSGPTRGGTRGGAAEFKWSDVKEDKDREHYLGHSVMAAAGRWQKNQDIHWYSRDQETADEAARKKAEEIRKVKEAEEDALALALGFAPAVRKTDEEKEVERILKEQQKQEKALRKAERHAEKLIKAEIKANIKAERKALKATSHVSEDGRSPRAVDKEKQRDRGEDEGRDRHAPRRRDDDRSSRHRDEERVGGRETLQDKKSKSEKKK